LPITNLRCNEQIRLSPIRLIDEVGGQRGVVPTDEALKMAREVGLDLVEVSPNERPPVCKIMDYGKHKYLQSKKLKQKHHEQKMKEVRIRPKTDPHDRQIKMEHARGFLAHGDRVQFTMIFRGRERFHQDIGNEAFNEIVTLLADISKVERPPKMLGKRMTMILVPSKLPTPGKPKPKPAAAKKEGSAASAPVKKEGSAPAAKTEAPAPAPTPTPVNPPQPA
jgi:translation initiation factor IF-3